MNEKAVCCSKCFRFLSEISPLCSTLWLRLCDYHKNDGLFFVDENDQADLITHLELLGFVTTTENASHLIVKVNGLTNDDEGDYYCPRGCYRSKT